MAPETIGLIGAVGGTLLGFLGGVIGTWNELRNAQGLQERAYLVKMSVLFWVVVPLFVVAVFLLPDPWNQYLWLPYGLWLTYTIRRSSIKQQALREAEAASQETL
ncbi:MAG TPA: hypothetical protein DIT97_25390 [Gimesia maris]|uniref:Uncharacterized protein n=1 Tax=Gimesia maris TaxID=122 RepID=A0A3D3RF08_9PLAN|nr:hypothetical protein [Gimesia maris]|tara:strand:+ start:15633 stop:15947 length:315 start_codon:yes stop_codon:yes gene_type:complete